MASNRQPKIAFFDIETYPMIVAVWQQYEANAIWVEQDTHLLSFAVKWAGRNGVKVHALPDYKGYERDKHNDAALVRDMWRVMEEADIIIAHNGDAFDIKKVNSRFAVHGLKPPAPHKSVDTLKIARKHFKFDSNKLDNLGRYLGVGRKLPNTGGHLWKRCGEGDPKAWRLMRRYNAQDVRLLEAVYLQLRPWGAHPNLNLYTGDRGCPVCQSNNVQARGFNVAKTRKVQRLHCQSCGHWFSGAPVK